MVTGVLQVTSAQKRKLTSSNSRLICYGHFDANAVGIGRNPSELPLFIYVLKSRRDCFLNPWDVTSLREIKL